MSTIEKNITEFIENKDLNLNQTEHYAAILGESPSKGARSPILWNAAFHDNQINAIMHPMDIHPENLEDAVKALKEDKRYIGGAITMPYKVNILPYLDEIEKEAQIIGAVNCIYRDGERLIGTNTDGAGALASLEEVYGAIEGKTVLALGTGGAGVAVATYLAKGVGEQGKIILANRSPQTRDEIAKKLKDYCNVESFDGWPIASATVARADIIVNSTSIGFETMKQDDNGYYSLKYYSPLGPVDESIRLEQNVEKEFVQMASGDIAKNYEQTIGCLSCLENPFVFDIVYQPLQTQLLAAASLMGYKTLNGLSMNGEQAVIAFVKATTSCGLFEGDKAQIRNSMQNA